MKYTVILIATVFLIGISVSDAAGKKKGTQDPKKDPQGEEPEATQENNGDEETDPPEDENLEGEEEEAPQEEDPQEESQEEPVKSAKKKSPPAKTQPAKKAPKKSTNSAPKKANKSLTPANLKDLAASMNPANLIGALQNTPLDQLQKILPQLNQLTKTLEGTPLGDVFGNLTSLVGNSSPENWNAVFQLFPNFLTTIQMTGAQLLALTSVALGRAGKTVVDFTDLGFNGVKDVLGLATKIPGVNIVAGPLADGVDLVHSTVVDPLDAGVQSFADTSKTQKKLLDRSASRKRSVDKGGRRGGGLFGF